MSLSYGWDPEKARTNWSKDRVSFEDAVTVFSDPLELTMHDPKHSGEEDRVITIGLSAFGRLLVVC